MSESLPLVSNAYFNRHRVELVDVMTFVSRFGIYYSFVPTDTDFDTETETDSMHWVAEVSEQWRIYIEKFSGALLRTKISLILSQFLGNIYKI